MKWTIRFIKRIFGIYETEYEYLVYTREIKVNPEWRKTRIGKEKFRRKFRYWYSTGEFESKIILDKNLILLMDIQVWELQKLKELKKFPFIL